MRLAPNEIRSDVKGLSAAYTLIGRINRSLYDYLIRLYRKAKKWRRRTSRNEVLSALGISHLDVRVSKCSVRLLIELTCKCDVKLKSRYANALRYAKRSKCGASDLEWFIREKGGLQSCARLLQFL